MMMRVSSAYYRIGHGRKGESGCSRSPEEEAWGTRRWRVSARRMKRYGDSGSPWRKPRWH